MNKLKNNEINESQSTIQQNKTETDEKATNKAVSTTAAPKYILVKESKRHQRQPRLPKYYREIPYYYFYSPMYAQGHIPDYYTPQLSFEATNMIDYVY